MPCLHLAGVAPTAAFPSGLQIILVDANFDSLCNMTTHVPAPPRTVAVSTGLLEIHTSFQNYPSSNNELDCRAALEAAAYIGFQSTAANLSVCMDDIRLLASAVVPQGAIQLRLPSQMACCAVLGCCAVLRCDALCSLCLAVLCCTAHVLCCAVLSIVTWATCLTVNYSAATLNILPSWWTP